MGTDIQDRLKAPKTDQKHHEKVFARLMLQGKVSAALRWVGSQRSALLEVNEDVLKDLPDAERKTSSGWGCLQSSSSPVKP